MQKIVELLEQKAEWIAILLGAAFVLFMTYAYILTPPAQVTVGSGGALGPGEVDPFTDEHVATQLDAAIKGTQTLSMSVPKHVEKFVDAMTWKTAAPVDFAGIWPSNNKDIVLPQKVATTPAPGVTPTGPGVVANAPPGKITALPEILAAVPAEVKVGRSVIIPPVAPDAAGNVAPAPAPGADAQGQDKDWVTQLFKISLADMDKAFQKVKLPPGFDKTMFLQVEMEREELDADGKPVPNTLMVIPPLAIWRSNTPPPPFPGNDANARAEQAVYLQWASTNTPDILQPTFYTTIPNKGDQWSKPGQAVAGAVVFDPATYIGALTVPPLTTEQRDAVLKYRRDVAKQREDERKSKVQPTTPHAPTRGGGGAGRGGPEGMNYAPPPPRPAAPPPRTSYPPPPGGGNRAVPFDGVGNEGGANWGGGGGPVAVQPGLPQPGTDYPTGEFAPGDKLWNAKTIEAWAHDDTVKAGKSYHYRIRYKIKNPIFAAANVAVNPALADIFAIVSPPSAWSDKVTIPAQVNFFVAGAMPDAKQVRFEVFRWNEGQQKKQEFVVSPGDQIGSMKDNIDFSTDWTVVDFRYDDRQQEMQILLVNKDGTITQRSHKADMNDPLYKQLKDQLQQQKLAETATAGGGAPGGAAGGH